MTFLPPELQVDAALGTVWRVWVGDEADLTQSDPVATEGVAVAPLAVHATLSLGAHALAEVRVEEGVVHAGALEAAEARIAWEAPWVGAWLGRGDLPLTRDRTREVEDLALSLRPTLSRVILPMHAGGVGGRLAWPDHLSLDAGLSWAASTSDAPVAWARLDLHPWGELPARESARLERGQASLGLGGAWLDSEALGTQAIATVDAELRWRGLRVTGGGLWERTVDRDGASGAASSLSAEAGTELLRRASVALRLDARGERVTGLEDLEDARWGWGARLTALTLADRVEVYAEGLQSREQGARAAADGVIVLDAGIERANDVYSLGARVRFP